MKHTLSLECTADISPGGNLILPEDIRRRLSAGRRARLRIEVLPEHSRLLERAIDVQEINTVAARQKLEPDIVELALSAEAAVEASMPLYDKIRALL